MVFILHGNKTHVRIIDNRINNKSHTYFIYCAFTTGRPSPVAFAVCCNDTNK